MSGLKEHQASEEVHECWVLSTATTASLSHFDITTLPSQCLPHIAAAITIGINSFVAMLVLSAMSVSSHGSWNHLLSQNAPQPHLPDASEMTVSETSRLPSDVSKQIPFHFSRNSHHHIKSDLTAEFRWTWCSIFWTQGRLSNRGRVGHGLPNISASQSIDQA